MIYRILKSIEKNSFIFNKMKFGNIKRKLEKKISLAKYH